MNRSLQMSGTMLIAGCFLLAGCQTESANGDSFPDGGQSTDTDTGTGDDHVPATCETALPSIDAVLASLQGLPIDQFLEEANKQLIMRSPEAVTKMGLAETYGVAEDELNNISDAYTKQTFDLIGEMLSLLGTYDESELTDDEMISYNAFEWYLKDKVENREFMYHSYPVSPMLDSVPYGLFLFFEDIHPVANKQNAMDYVTRLGRIENKLACLRQRIDLCEQAGVTPLQFMIHDAMSNLGGIVPGSGRQLSFYTALENKLTDVQDMSDAQKQDLLDSAETVIEESVIPAYMDVVSVLQDMLPDALPDNGVWQLPDGDAYYAYMLSHHTTTDLTADEIHQLGLEEVARIRGEIQVLFDELGYPADEDLSQLYTRVALDSGYIPMADVVAAYEGIIEATEPKLPEAFDIFPEADVIVIGGSSGGYYVSGSMDGERPGAFYVWADGNVPWYEMPTLTYHEAIPGHHFQISIAQELGLPAVRISEFTSYVEGWALYAERLAKELGWYEDDIYGDLGRLQDEMLRAVRLVVDTGMHAKGWSFGQCAAYMVENMGTSQGYANSAVARYMSWPGQAVAYKVGMIKLLELRDKAAEDLGDDYDLKEFHRTVLTAGSVPLGLLEEIVQAYIDLK